MRACWLSALVLVAALLAGPTAAAASVDLVGAQDAVQALRITEIGVELQLCVGERPGRRQHLCLQPGALGRDGAARGGLGDPVGYPPVKHPNQRQEHLDTGRRSAARINGQYQTTAGGHRR